MSEEEFPKAFLEWVRIREKVENLLIKQTLKLVIGLMLVGIIDLKIDPPFFNCWIGGCWRWNRTRVSGQVLKWSNKIVKLLFFFIENFCSKNYFMIGLVPHFCSKNYFMIGLVPRLVLTRVNSYDAFSLKYLKLTTQTFFFCGCINETVFFLSLFKSR